MGKEAESLMYKLRIICIEWYEQRMHMLELKKVFSIGYKLQNASANNVYIKYNTYIFYA